MGLAAGCYTYRAAPPESLPAGAAVRARLSPAGAEGVMRLTGDLSPRVEGILVGSGPDSVVLEVWRTDLRTGRTFQPGLVRVAVPRPEVLEVNRKQLSPVRTGALAALVGVGAYQLYRVLWDDAGGLRNRAGPRRRARALRLLQAVTRQDGRPRGGR